MPQRTIASFGWLVVLLVAASATAGDFWLGTRGPAGHQPGDVYVGLGGSGLEYPLPDVEIWNVGDNSFPPQSRHFRYSRDLFAGGGGGTLGWVLPDGLLPEAVGRNVRVELSGGFWAGETTDRDNRPDRIDFAIVPIDGTLNTTFGTATGFGSTLETDLERWELALRVAADHEIFPHVFLTPSIGIFGGESRERYALEWRLSPTRSTGSGGFVRERNESTRIGGDVGFDLAYQPTEQLMLHLGTRIGGFDIETDLDGRDCRGTGLSSGADCMPATATIATSVRDSDSGTSVRGVLSAGLTVDLEWFVIEIGGFGSYESDLPRVDNPTPEWVPSPGGGGGFTLQQDEPAHVDFSDGYLFGAYVTIRVPLRTVTSLLP